MRVCWMFVVLLGCSSSSSTQSEFLCDCKEQVETLFFTANSISSVTVRCHNMTKSEEIMYKLFKDNASIYKYSYNKTGPSHSSGQIQSWNNVSTLLNTQGQFLGFKLTGATASSQGIYRCQGTVIYPPPLITNCSHRVVVFVQGEGEGGQTLVWVWILVVVLLGTYSLIISIYAVCTAIKLRNTECNNDYMNTKPSAPRRNKNNRGIQTPIPRHF